MSRRISKKPSKQRKLLFNAPLHRKGKIMSVHLSRELREKYGIRSFPIRKGDKVRVMRGDAKGAEGKVIRVNRKKYVVYIEGITREKQSGETVHIPIHYSNLMITELDLNDEWRKKKLEELAKARGAT